MSKKACKAVWVVDPDCKAQLLHFGFISGDPPSDEVKAMAAMTMWFDRATAQFRFRAKKDKP